MLPGFSFVLRLMALFLIVARFRCSGVPTYYQSKKTQYKQIFARIRAYFTRARDKRGRRSEHRHREKLTRSPSARSHTREKVAKVAKVGKVARVPKSAKSRKLPESRKLPKSAKSIVGQLFYKVGKVAKVGKSRKLLVGVDSR